MMPTRLLAMRRMHSLCIQSRARACGLSAAWIDQFTRTSTLMPANASAAPE
jgi:hypothetical protein